MAMIESFAARLGELRAERGLSKSALARAVDVTPMCVVNWEKGNTRPRPDALARLASALKTTPAYLERGVLPPPVLPTVSPTTAVPTSPRARATVAELISKARAEIAEAAELSVDQVKVVLEYGA